MAKIYTLATALLTFALASYAAIPVRWTTDAYKVKPLVYECYHGETLDLAAALTAYGEPLDFAGKTARLYWQTNGMESAWWSTNAFVRAEAGATNILAAIWSGAYDAGAASVTGFIGVEGENYRAAFQLNFRPSPGFVPNQMPIPPKTIDWANVANANVDAAPFALKGSGLTPEQAKVIAANQVTNDVAPWAMAGKSEPQGMTTNAVENISDNRITNSVLSGYLCTVEAARGMTNDAVVTAKSYADAAVLSASFITYNDTRIVGNLDVQTRQPAGYIPSEMTSALTDYAPWRFYPNGHGEGEFIGTPTLCVTYGGSGPAQWDAAVYTKTGDNEWTFYGGAQFMEFPQKFSYQGASGWSKTATLAKVSDVTAATNALPSWTKTATKPSYTAGEVGAATPSYVDQQNATTRAIVATWENFLDGSNVVFSITNYISGTYNLDTAKLRIMEMTNNVYREVYNSRDEILLHINDFKNTDFATATNHVIQGVSAAIADKADKAWGKYTSAGGEAPSNTVYMTAPNTVFAGGLEYERVAVGEGAVCILTTKGAPTYTQGDEGTFKFQDDGGTNYFGFAKTDSYVIGADASGISAQNNIVTIRYDVTMSGVPCIWYKADLSSNVAWEQLNLPDGTPVAGASHVVTWEATPPAGQEICYINCPEAQGFFKATIEVAGSAKFMTNMPADLGGGIMCTNTATHTMGIIKPTYNGSSVTWSWEGL